MPRSYQRFLLICVLNGAIDVFLAAVIDPWTNNIASLGFYGFVTGQSCILAMWSVMGGGRYLLRFAAAWLVLVGIGHGMILTDNLFRAGDHFDSLLAVATQCNAAFLLLQIPFWLVRRFSGWRFVTLGERRASDSTRFRFLMSDLFLALTFAAIFMEISRSIILSTNGPGSAKLGLAFILFAALPGGVALLTVRYVLAYEPRTFGKTFVAVLSGTLLTLLAAQLMSMLRPPSGFQLHLPEALALNLSVVLVSAANSLIFRLGRHRLA